MGGGWKAVYEVVGGKHSGEGSSTLQQSEIQGELLQGHFTRVPMHSDSRRLIARGSLGAPPCAFSRAFQQLHDTSSSQQRFEGGSLVLILLCHFSFILFFSFLALLLVFMFAKSLPQQYPRWSSSSASSCLLISVADMP